MAKLDEYLDLTGLQYYHNRIKTQFASQTDLDTLEDKVDDIISEGGEPNVIEVVQKNGTALPVTNKTVNVTVPTTTSELTNDSNFVEDTEGTTASLVANSENELGLSNTSHSSLSFSNNTTNKYVTMTMTAEGGTPTSANLATTDYVTANGGKIDHIQVNGTEQTITNKTVNIAVPTKVSDITNDSGYQNATQVQGLIDDALADITGIDFQVVQTLPATGVKGTIYLVANSGTAPNIYDEYIYTNNAWEKIGTTDVDLSQYWAKADLVAITTAEIDTLFA